MPTRITLVALAFIAASVFPAFVGAQPKAGAPPAPAAAPARAPAAPAAKAPAAPAAKAPAAPAAKAPAAPAAAAAPAADQAAAFKHVEFLTRKAVDQFELLEFDSAKKTLADAQALCEKHRLAAYGACARVSMLQGLLAITAYKDRFSGRKGFIKALTVDSSQRIDAALSTPEAEEIFASAQKEAEAVRRAAPPPPLPLPPGPAVPAPREGEGEAAEGEGEAEEREVDPRDVRGIFHNAVGEAPQSTPVRIKCVVGPDVAVSKVFVFYRTKGRDDWTPEVMSQTRGAYVATIPATMVKPPAIDYYIEVRDGRGKPQIASGNVISPHQIRVVLPRANAAGPRGPIVAKRVLVEDELDEAARIKRRQREAGTRLPLWARLTLGTGFGWIGKGAKPDAGSSAGALEAGGFASAPLHLSPEVGINLTDNIAVSVVGRLQVLTMADKGSSFTGAGLARGYWIFGGQKLRPFADLSVGAGYIIHTTDVRPPGGELKANSFKAGAFLVGFGGGVTYAITRRILLIGELQALIGAPTNFTVNFDVNLGAGFNF
jgi:hypothetical protein